MIIPRGSLLHEVNLTTARNLSPLFDEAVRKERPVVIVRGGRERGLLVAQDMLARALAAYHFHVDVLPEEDGRWTLWLNGLEIGGTGQSLTEARAGLLAASRSFAANYLDQLDFYRHLPEMARLEPYVLRIALAEDDAALARALFAPPVEAAASP